MRGLLAGAIMVIGPIISDAQEARVLTFEETIKIALSNSVSLNQQKNQLEYNQAQKASAIAQFVPSVSANLQAAQFNGNSFNQQQGRVINGIRDNISGSVNANVVLFNGLSKISSLKAASKQVEAQSYFVKRTSQDVINTVSAQYLQILLDVELYRIAEKNLETQKKQLEQVKAQVELGSRPPVDEPNQLATTNGAELRLIQAEVALNNDKALLKSTLLLDPFVDFEVKKPEWDLNEILSDNRNHEELFEAAKENRGDLLRALNQEEASLFNMNATRANMTPTLLAFFNLGSSFNFQHGIPDSVLAREPSINRPFGSQFGTDNIYKSYGLQLSIPLFNGFQSRTNYYQQKVLYRNSKLNRSNAEILAKTDVFRTYQNLQTQKKTYTVSQSQFSAAEVAFQLESERYNLGITNFVDYVRANQAYVQAETDLAQAEFRLLFQKVLVEYATGTLKIEDLQD